LCHPPKRTLKPDQVAWSVALVCAGLLLAVLWWFIPAVGQGAAAFWIWAQGFGDGMGGLLTLAVIIAVIGGGVWQRKRLADIVRDLWEKLS
jgi:hypothetical protein